MIFFARFDPKILLQGSIDLAFLDGLHLFEFLLRDFFHLEKFCSKNSVIVMHDCIPIDEYICTRAESDFETRSHSNHPEWWTGDVWKMLPILRAYRPDLKIYSFDAAPTGLVMITNLDPFSSVLSDNYFDIIEKFRCKNFGHGGIENFFAGLELRSTSSIMTFEQMSHLFWL